MKSSIKERNELIQKMIDDGHKVIILDPKSEYKDLINNAEYEKVKMCCIFNPEEGQ